MAYICTSQKEDSFYIYRPQRSCEGYVFTGVCLSTEGWGCLPQYMLWYPPRSRHPLPGQTPRSQSRHAPPGSRHPPRADTPPPRYGHCCGRYASYWNAFLFIDFIVIIVKRTCISKSHIHIGTNKCFNILKVHWHVRLFGQYQFFYPVKKNRLRNRRLKCSINLASAASVLKSHFKCLTNQFHSIFRLYHLSCRITFSKRLFYSDINKERKRKLSFKYSVTLGPAYNEFG